MKFGEYLLNCLLLTLPILLWDYIFTDRLPKAFQPDIFWKGIPSFIIYGENISRLIVFAFIVLMPLRISTNAQKNGFVLYAAGILLYFASWLMLMYFQESIWSNSLLGFVAPACTPLLWLMGIGLIGNSFYFNIPYNKWLFFLAVSTFLIFHSWHTYLIYFRTH